MRAISKVGIFLFTCYSFRGAKHIYVILIKVKTKNYKHALPFVLYGKGSEANVFKIDSLLRNKTTSDHSL